MATETNETSADDERDENPKQQRSDSGSSESKDGESKDSESQTGASENSDSQSGDSDEKPDFGTDDKSQEEMAEEAREARRKQKVESKRKAGSIIMIASTLLGIIALICLYLGQSVTGNHPLAQQSMYFVGVLNLVLALAVYIRKNWPRTLVLCAMPLTIVLTALSLTVIGQAKYLVFVLCLVEIYIMFRQPILDEFDAPEE